MLYMKKDNFKKMALMGMATGMLFAAQAPVEAHNDQATHLAAGKSSCGQRSSCGQKSRSQGYVADMSEMDTQYGKSPQDKEFMKSLDEEGRMLYLGLDQEGRSMAQKYAEQGKDKNESVREAAKRMADKRSGVQ